MLKAIRWILGKIILTLDSLFPPKSPERTPAEQAKINQKTAGLALYQFQACPFCVKVRRAMKRMGVQIELRDAKESSQYADELLRGGGSLQVPCLRIPEAGGNVRWMYESSDIIGYLAKLVE